MQHSAENIAFKERLKAISIRELNERINFFRLKIDLRTISEQRLKAELRKILTVQINGRSEFFFIKNDTQTDLYERFTFYRIRKFSEHDNLNEFYFPSITWESDIWAKPPHKVETYGRLNRIGEGVLYAAKECINAVYETDCQVGDKFFLMVYNTKQRMRVSQIHTISYIDEFTELENAKLITVHNFLLSEFTKFASKGREYLYKSSVTIFEEYFNNPYIDAFCYPSIRTPLNVGYNIAFNQQQAEKNLNFLGLMVCELCSPRTDNEEFSMKVYYDGFLNPNGTFDFYSPTSEISKQLFGNFNALRNMWWKTDGFL
jgi:hypothetical protein